MKKFIIVFLLVAVAFLGCQKLVKRDYKITLLFEDIKNLYIRAPIFLGDMQIGEVINIKDNNAVLCKIYSNYIDSLKVGSKFYLLDKNDRSRIEFVMNKESREILPNNCKMKGYQQKDFLIDKTKKLANKFFNKSYNKAKEFFQSEDWKKFKEETAKQIDNALKKGKKELDKQLPKLKEKAFEMYNKSPEMLDNAKAFIDSLVNEKVNKQKRQGDKSEN